MAREAGLASLDVDESDHPNPLVNLVKLVSKDGYEFIMPRDVAMASGTLKTILTSKGQWREQAGPMPTVELETLNAPVLEKVIQYMFYKARYNHTPPPIPPFPIEMDSIVPLLLAANFLDT